ncbi:MAG: rhomboid family intramembrane serine protease [Bacteroidota bacterium]|nr:rhomboid family intramembrane serine protease [Bacteroidota bacterium]
MANFNRPGGGRVNFGGFLHNTPVIRSLLYANVGVFLFQMFFGKLRLSGVPFDFYIAKYLYLWPLGSGNFYPWQLISYMFLHGSFMHIAFNMLALWMFGLQFEVIWGPKKFLTYYFLCGLGGAVAHLLISPLLGGAGPLIGASGAVFGLLIAYGLLFPDQLVFVFFMLPMKAKYAIGLFVVLEFMSVGAADNVGHLAHLGGAVVGLIYLLATNGGLKLISGIRMPGRNSGSESWQSRSGGGGMFRKRPTDDDDLIDAEYHDIGGTVTKAHGGTRIITQEDIDRILDKIAASGYQNLSEEEREILIEASRKMDKGN